MNGETAKWMFVQIDKIISDLDKFDEFKCPDHQMKNHYLKCCHIVWALQKIVRITNDESLKLKLTIAKEWMSELRGVKE